MSTKSVSPVSTTASMDSIQTTRRHDRSTLMFIMQHLIKPFKAKTIELPPDRGSKGSVKLTPHRYARKRCHITARQVEDIHVYDLVSKAHGPSRNNETMTRLFYMSGGGWQCSPNATHWTFLTRLSERLPDTIVTLVSYPLAPLTAAPDSIPHLLRFYHTAFRESMDKGEKTILAGDSAGGNLALCLPLTALSNTPDAPVPDALLVISPSTDLRRSNPEISRLEKHDPILFRKFIVQTAEEWAGSWPLDDPRISPLFADVAPLVARNVRVYGVSGGYDILGPDALLMRDKLNEAGVRGKWLEWDKQMHIFPLLRRFKLRESQQATDWIVETLKECG